jgi:hypothetical protein
MAPSLLYITLRVVCGLGSTGVMCSVAFVCFSASGARLLLRPRQCPETDGAAHFRTATSLANSTTTQQQHLPRLIATRSPSEPDLFSPPSSDSSIHHNTTSSALPAEFRHSSAFSIPLRRSTHTYHLNAFVFVFTATQLLQTYTHLEYT